MRQVHLNRSHALQNIMKLMTLLRQDKVRCLQTLSLLITTFGMGLTLAVVGPTMLDLQQQTHCSLDQITQILNMRAAGSIPGALLSKLMRKKKGNKSHIHSQFGAHSTGS